ncbi:MAG: septal ring lytic transglycosylase RlpA family protein [Candidatus Binataceae bacterium]
MTDYHTFVFLAGAGADKMQESFAIAIARMKIALSVPASARAAASVIFVILAPIGLAGCAAQSSAPDFSRSSYQSRGSSLRSLNPVIAPHVEVASWYGPGFQGHPTSTGERFNEYGLTAASKTLALGSTVRVINPKNGRSVDVRINDRGPYVRGRSIDLSKGAAQRLGMSGVAPVIVASPRDAPARVVYSHPRALATRYHSANHLTYAEQSPSDTAPRWPRWHTSYHVAARRSRRHSRTVWNPVGAWIASSLRAL